MYYCKNIKDNLHRCCTCKEWKTKDLFHSNRANSCGLNNTCKKCRLGMVRSNPQWQRTADLKRLYGITEKDYQLLFEKQDGKCATCLKPATDFTLRLSVDHEHGHTAGHKMNQRACKQCIRGLLCWSCNRILLPMVETAMDRVERGIVYLKERPLA